MQALRSLLYYSLDMESDLHLLFLGQYIANLPLEEKTAIQAIEIQLILSVVLFILSWISSFFIFLRISHRGELDPTTTIKF